jgi:hypothetical protein
MLAIALRVEAYSATPTLAEMRHDAITLARRLDLPITFTYVGANYLILPRDTCHDNCKQCPSTTVPIHVPEPHWEAA